MIIQKKTYNCLSCGHYFESENSYDKCPECNDTGLELVPEGSSEDRIWDFYDEDEVSLA
jgi:Zn finger protein HypA/HybF involved in hydrogenase expression